MRTGEGGRTSEEERGEKKSKNRKQRIDKVRR